MQRFPSDSKSEYLVARAIAVGNYLAVVALFQTLTPLPKCCFKNAKVRSRANSATYLRSAELSA